MPRPVWRGHISFGLVHIPVNLYNAERRTDLQLHMIDSRDKSRVRYERVNADTGAEVPWDSIVKGYEYSDGQYVILNDEELKRAAPEATRSIDIEAFVKVEEIDPIYFDKPYYLEPGKGAEKGYVLLRTAMREAGKVGIARVVIRTRQYMAALSARDELLVLDLLRYRQEILPTDELNIPKNLTRGHGVTNQELKIAGTLIDSMSDAWRPEKYHDEYREQLMKWIEQKVKSGDMHHPAEETSDEPEAPAPINFMEALKRSLGEKAGKPSSPSGAGRKAAPRARSGGGKSGKRAPARTGARAAVRSGARAGARSGVRGGKKVAARRKAG
jgi:DNA end-binding protein Ku